MIPVIKKILEIAVYAPSGDNCQPWRFEVDGDFLEIHNIEHPTYDHPFYNFHQKGSFFAHGCLIENIIIASSQEGYSVGTELFPDNRNSNFVARLRFIPGSATRDELFAHIDRRVTNRKKYKKIPLSAAQQQALLNLNQLAGTPVRVHLTDKREDLIRLGRALSVNEKIVLESKELHQTFFSHIVWSGVEEKKVRSGLYLRTMELPPPIRGIFRLIRRWPIQRTMNKLGFSKLAAANNAQIYSSGSAMGILTMENDSNNNFVSAGRIFQRIWLQCTSMGLSLQPITGILYLMARVLAGETGQLSRHHIELVKKSYGEIESIFGMSGATIPVLFRVGYAAEPSARTSRKLPDITLRS